MRWKSDVCGPRTTTMMSKARPFPSFCDSLNRKPMRTNEKAPAAVSDRG